MLELMHLKNDDLHISGSLYIFYSSQVLLQIEKNQFQGKKSLFEKRSKIGESERKTLIDSSSNLRQTSPTFITVNNFVS
jgi:hypothetical protein